LTKEHFIVMLPGQIYTLVDWLM